MDVSSIMSSNLAELQRTVSMSILNKSIGGQAEIASQMISDFSGANPTPPPSSNIMDCYG